MGNYLREIKAEAKAEAEIKGKMPDFRLADVRLVICQRSSGDEQHIAFKSGDLNEQSCFQHMFLKKNMCCS